MITVGQKLAKERQKRGLSLSDVEQKTKIKASFINAIEKGEYYRLPSAAYAPGFVKNYVQFLGLPERETLAMFRREFDEKREYKVLPESYSNNKSYSSWHFRMQRRIFVIAAFVLVFLFYLLYQYRYAFVNPPLTVISPKDKSVVSRDVLVSGKTDVNAVVIVNSVPVSVDENGEFAKKITLFQDNSTITIVAKNRLNKETTVIRHVTISQ